MADQSETRCDQPLRFSIPALNARGRLVRLDAVLNDVLSAHAYPPAVEKILAEALVLTALLGTTLKEREGQLTIQAQTENGPVSLLVCDYIDGAVRGYAQFDLAKLAEVPADPNLFALFGKGYLAVTFDRPLPEAEGGGRYQGIVPLEGASISDAAMQYFDQSEQIPTFIRIAIDHVDGRCVAGGMLVQHLPDGEEGRERIAARGDHPDWEHVRILSETVKADELADPALSLEEIAWRLFHEEQEVRIVEGRPMSKGCRCDPDHIRDVIARFPAGERAEMADEAGDIVVNCEFCSRKFPISLASLNN
ncbi:MAG: Hsp33 family molecular chaperone HslO [Sphingomonadales bacterium]|jgi:molecular chaperone Hsp33|nr:Hsp33 family molecular chaperone HslO [Sphingomonadales bacterium]MBK9268210.1 Hsp33 family molecular chaperone HslO [Sphingomonadales bacterium]MBP6434229.1 Hsp33 family molecular chaperone HslO [Sphingorhabdus sp.]